MLDKEALGKWPYIYREREREETVTLDGRPYIYIYME